MPLHRLVTPTYSGGLPGTHDYINDPVANGDPGAPAPADGKKAAAPAPGDQNEGTYFVAFSEPAQAEHVNRGLQALAENTDFLDDVVHRDVAVPATFTVAFGHGGTSSFVLPGDVFVGPPGTVDDTFTRTQLVEIVGPSGLTPSIPAFGGVYFPSVADLIHDGAAVSVIGQGFYTNPTVDLSIPIDTSVTFKVNYFVRGSVKTQPAGLVPFSSDRGFTSAAVSALVQQLGAYSASKIQANTFIAGQTQTFSGPVTLEKAVSLAKPSTEAAFTNTDTGLKRVLINEFRVNEAPNVYARLYKVRDSGAVNRGFELTFNARYATDTAPEWRSDSTSTNYHPTRWRFSGAGFGFGGEGFYYEVLDNGTLGGGQWAETAWGASSVRAAAFAGGSVQSLDRRVTPPAFEAAFGATGAPDGHASNPYKLLLQAATAGAQRLRLYVGTGGDAGTGTGGMGQFLVVVNAVYNSATLLWTQDDGTKESYALALRARDGVTSSSLSGPNGGADSNQATAVVWLYKNSGAGSWAGNQWEKTSGIAGHMRVVGHYCYSSGVGGKEMTYTVNPLNLVPKPGSAWALTDSLSLGGGTEGFTWQNATGNEDIFVPLDLPFGAKITSCFAEVDPILAGAGNRLFLQLYRQVISTRIASSLGTVETDGTTNPQTITLNSGSVPHYVQDDSVYYLRIRHAVSPGTEVIRKVAVNYLARVNAPGPGVPTTEAFQP